MRALCNSGAMIANDFHYMIANDFHYANIHGFNNVFIRIFAIHQRELNV